MHVGFIGLGSQGGPMAGRIIEAGFPTSLWARRPAALEPFSETAAKVAGSPAELAAASDLICLCVVGDTDVEEVTSGDDGVLAGVKPGGVIETSCSRVKLPCAGSHAKVIKVLPISLS